MRERMVDWSRHQGQTDLAKAIDEWGIVGLMARCTIGFGYADAWYEWNFEQAQRLGILFGAYHVLYPWNRNPGKEVDWFARHIMVNGTLPDFVVADLELPHTEDGWKTITPKEVGQQIVSLLPALAARTGKRVFVYTGSWWWNGTIGNCLMGKVTPLGIEQDYMLWESEYPINTPVGGIQFSQAPEAPKMPTLGKGWTDKDLVGWQWTSCLKPTGVQSKSQDADVLIPTFDEFLVIIGKAAPPLSDKVKLDRLWEAHPELHDG